VILQEERKASIVKVKANMKPICSSYTERRGTVVSTSASYSGGPGFKARLGDRLP
jgi:hypothetical protein